MKIAIDFDGVLCKRKGIPTIKEPVSNCEPMEDALDAIKLFKKMGNEVWVFTSNEDPDGVRLWLNTNGFPELEVTNIKKPAHAYIDDRAIRFDNWQNIRKYFS